MYNQANIWNNWYSIGAVYVCDGKDNTMVLLIRHLPMQINKHELLFIIAYTCMHVIIFVNNIVYCGFGL